jgi:hypothetical protein
MFTPHGEHGNVYMPELVERVRYSTGLISFTRRFKSSCRHWGARLNCQFTAKQSKTLRLQIFRHCASQVRILPRVYALVCKRSKQVCYYVDSKLILGQTVTPHSVDAVGPGSNPGRIWGARKHTPT